MRLKANLPTLWEATRARFLGEPPTSVVEIDGERVELWDAADLDPWEPLRWATVRVLRYRLSAAGNASGADGDRVCAPTATEPEGAGRLRHQLSPALLISTLRPTLLSQTDAPTALNC